MTDEFKEYKSGLTSPATKHNTIVADAIDPIDPRPRSVYCSVDGDITIEDEDGTSLVYSMVAGQVLTIRPYKVTAITGTFIGWR